MMLWENGQGFTHLLIYSHAEIMAPNFCTLNFMSEFVVVYKSKDGRLHFSVEPDSVQSKCAALS